MEKAQIDAVKAYLDFSKSNQFGVVINEDFNKLRDLTNEIRNLNLKSSYEGEKEVNRRKNRYRDILPYDDSRVRLDPIKIGGGDENEKVIVGSDYINANIIRSSHDGYYRYIAAQGPTRDTVADFIRMLVQYNIKIVICACNEYEGQKLKCHRYWTDQEPYMFAKNHSVTVKSKQELDGCIIRQLKVRYISPSSLSSTTSSSNNNAQEYHSTNSSMRHHSSGSTKQLMSQSASSLAFDDHYHHYNHHYNNHHYHAPPPPPSEAATPLFSEYEFTQFHLVAWPDHGVPDSIESVISILARVRQKMLENNRIANEQLGKHGKSAKKSCHVPLSNDFLLVHCSAGCGRTGTIIAIDQVWNLLNENRLNSSFSLYELARSLREQRIAMIQTLSQYLFFAKATAYLFEMHLKELKENQSNLSNKHQQASSNCNASHRLVNGISSHQQDSHQNKPVIYQQQQQNDAQSNNSIRVAKTVETTNENKTNSVDAKAAAKATPPSSSKIPHYQISSQQQQHEKANSYNVGTKGGSQASVKTINSNNKEPGWAAQANTSPLSTVKHKTHRFVKDVLNIFSSTATSSNSQSSSSSSSSHSYNANLPSPPKALSTPPNSTISSSSSSTSSSSSSSSSSSPSPLSISSTNSNKTTSSSSSSRTTTNPTTRTKTTTNPLLIEESAYNLTTTTTSDLFNNFGSSSPSSKLIAARSKGIPAAATTTPETAARNTPTPTTPSTPSTPTTPTMTKEELFTPGTSNRQSRYIYAPLASKLGGNSGGKFDATVTGSVASSPANSTSNTPPLDSSLFQNRKGSVTKNGSPSSIRSQQAAPSSPIIINKAKSGRKAADKNNNNESASYNGQLAAITLENISNHSSSNEADEDRELITPTTMPFSGGPELYLNDKSMYKKDPGSVCEFLSNKLRNGSSSKEESIEDETKRSVYDIPGEVASVSAADNVLMETTAAPRQRRSSSRVDTSANDLVVSDVVTAPSKSSSSPPANLSSSSLMFKNVKIIQNQFKTSPTHSDVSLKAHIKESDTVSESTSSKSLNQQQQPKFRRTNFGYYDINNNTTTSSHQNSSSLKMVPFSQPLNINDIENDLSENDQDTMTSTTTSTATTTKEVLFSSSLPKSQAPPLPPTLQQQQQPIHIPATPPVPPARHKARKLTINMAAPPPPLPASQPPPSDVQPAKSAVNSASGIQFRAALDRQLPQNSKYVEIRMNAANAANQVAGDKQLVQTSHRNAVLFAEAASSPPNNAAAEISYENNNQVSVTPRKITQPYYKLRPQKNDMSFTLTLPNKKYLHISNYNQISDFEMKESCDETSIASTSGKQSTSNQNISPFPFTRTPMSASLVVGGSSSSASTAAPLTPTTTSKHHHHHHHHQLNSHAHRNYVYYLSNFHQFGNNNMSNSSSSNLSATNSSSPASNMMMKLAGSKKSSKYESMLLTNSPLNGVDEANSEMSKSNKRRSAQIFNL